MKVKVLEDIKFGYNHIIKTGTIVEIMREEKDLDIVLLKTSDDYKVRV